MSVMAMVVRLFWIIIAPFGMLVPKPNAAVIVLVVVPSVRAVRPAPLAVPLMRRRARARKARARARSRTRKARARARSYVDKRD